MSADQVWSFQIPQDQAATMIIEVIIDGLVERASVMILPGQCYVVALSPAGQLRVIRENQ